MSLEQKIEALTAAIEANTKALGGSGDTAAKKTTTAGKKTPAKKAEITVDQIAEAYGGYLNSGSAAAKKKAKQVVKGIVEHFEAERISKIDPDHFQEAMDLLAQYKDGEDPLDIFDSDEDDDDGMV